MEIVEFKAKEFWSHIQSLPPDPRTKDWPLMEFNHVLYCCLGYLVLIFVGKAIMKNVEKFELKGLRILHNGALTLFNFYLIAEMIHQAVVSTGTLYHPIIRDERGLGMAKVLYLYYLSKIWEFMDTFIMVLRKSENQITVLHVYHHLSVTLIWWFDTKFYPGGEAWPAAWLNSFIHVVMYGYYFLATLGYNPWWKKFLTQMQMTQLSFFIVWGVYCYVNGSEEFRFISLMNGIYAGTVLVLFMNFYVQSYLKGSRAKSNKSNGTKSEAGAAGATSPTTFH